ncbi:MAG: tetraacyldisaccharide 4'-kinase, partial [bacterium]
GEDALTGIRERIAREFPGKPVIESRHEPSGIVAYKQCCEAPGAGDMIGRKLVCVSGIGNPAAFENVVARITGQENPAFRFDDHHPFGVGDLSRVEDEAIRCGADYIVTTEKDAARLPGNFNPRCRWLILRVDIAIIAGGGHAEEILTLSGNLFRKAAAPYNIQ